MSLTRSRLILGLTAVALAVAVLLGTTTFKGQAAGVGEALKTPGVPRSAPRVNADDDVRAARLVAVMGQSSLDLRQLNLAPGERLFIDVLVTMGRATVRIPDHWLLTTSGLPVMGSIRQPAAAKAADAAPAPATGPPPQLILRGIVLMGKVEVTS